QNHEAANRLHTVVSLLEMGRPDEAVAFATSELELAQQLTDQVVAAVGDPVVAALLLGKTAEAAERGVVLSVAGGLPADVGPVQPRELVTVLGNLVDNAFDAVAGRAGPRVEVSLAGDGDRLRVVVDDSGPGLAPEEAAQAMERGWTTKASSGETGGRGLGLALVGQVARRHAGRVRVDSSPLGGARFEVEIHLGPEEEA
ncbi:MAG: sensor histidine kinase, partial [Nocardioides sp.]